ncbi:hypothetical protein UFOVP669_2 [uncultured Caudovirales phage]|uniref:Bbp19-like phage domain-containing protein n=1 Tax=uncultured Caudovirales phage TaxID=2100421 RepID=A0A6J5N8E9_9CAUD|nr:hypothetical protein UFOVP400_50 [uncultured Caudovirales phage]CAB4155359.1 hypothetical protein UFOVP669_2 [uncultured Caudovirales phage]CAB4213398.1 hypothetical protein UFOVP1449_13 [uncultured Caudovirales phage]
MLRFRQPAYRKTFDNPEGRKVLADLRRFCRATTPTANVDNVYATYLLEGRREVFLRILAHLNLTEEDVIKLVEETPNE